MRDGGERQHPPGRGDRNARLVLTEALLVTTRQELTSTNRTIERLLAIVEKVAGVSPPAPPASPTLRLVKAAPAVVPIRQLAGLGKEGA